MEKFIKMFKALSDETRLRIYLLLLKEELCVCELVNILNMEQSRISHGLKILKEADLINSKRDGKWIIYSADSMGSNNKIILGIKQEIESPENDLKILNEYKKKMVTKKCKIKEFIKEV